MELNISKIIEDKENLILERREISFLVDAEKCPSISEIVDLVSENFKVNKDLTIIKKIKGKFGRDNFLISTFLYKDAEQKEKFEGIKKKAAI